MKPVLNLALILILVLAWPNTVGNHKLVDSTTASLDRIIDMDQSEGTLLLALDNLAIEHRVPIGFEQAIDSRDNINREIRLQRGTLKNILDSLVAQEPRYKWELREGVINITPKTSRDPILEEFLNTRVAQFVPPAGTTDKFKLRDAVLALPEVQQLLKAKAVTVKPYSYPYRRSIYSTDAVDLAISNTDVRSVLNLMAKETEHKIWSLERVGENKGLLLTF